MLNVLKEVASERIAQEDKWGQQNHIDYSAPYGVIGPLLGHTDSLRFQCDSKAKGVENSGPISYFDILLEEVGEARDEAREGNKKALREELIQVAAVAVAWVEKLDRDTNES